MCNVVRSRSRVDGQESRRGGGWKLRANLALTLRGGAKGARARRASGARGFAGSFRLKLIASWWNRWRCSRQEKGWWTRLVRGGAQKGCTEKRTASTRPLSDEKLCFFPLFLSICLSLSPSLSLFLSLSISFARSYDPPLLIFSSTPVFILLSLSPWSPNSGVEAG